MPDPRLSAVDDEGRPPQRHIVWLVAGLVVLPWLFAAAGFAVGRFTCGG